MSPTPIDASVPAARVLVIDDETQIRRFLDISLRAQGYQVRQAATGQEGLQLAASEDMDLVILDMIMDPGLDGLATYRNILEIQPRQKAIIVSGFAETDRVKEAQKLGAGQYLKKPYTLEKIAMAVRRELDKAA